MPTIYKHKQPLPLSRACEDFIVKYLHHVVWRQLDPPRRNCHSCFQPAHLPLTSLLPNKAAPSKDPVVFRRKLASIRSYLRDNLVGPVHDNLSDYCHMFVSEHRLKYGDVLLCLILQDKQSSSMRLDVKQIMFKKWSIREKMCLKRTLRVSDRLVKLAVPGKVDDSLLFIIAKSCRLIEDLDISTSYISDKGVLALCGVIIKDNQIVNQQQNISETESSDNGSATFFRKLGIHRNMSRELVENFSLLTAKVKPYIDKRLNPGSIEDKFSWSAGPNSRKSYMFDKSLGCPYIKRLDITRTNYPKRSLDNSGKMVVTYGVTRDSVLAILILMVKMLDLRWTELGDIIETYYQLLFELGLEENQRLHLGLLHLMDVSTSMRKLKAAQSICPRISKLDLPMFNFSASFEDMFGIVHSAGSSVDSDRDKRHYIDILFGFKHLNDFEVQFMDDSEYFLRSIQQYGGGLTRICLSKMVSVTFQTLAAIKRFCKGLTVFELHVDNIATQDNQELRLEILATENGSLPLLTSLKLGGHVNSENGALLKFIVSGCDALKSLCYTPYSEVSQANSVNDEFMARWLEEQPFQQLTVFCFEKCWLSGTTFFNLLEKAPNIKYIGNMAEWFMSRRERLVLQAFINGNNIDVDIDSLMYGCDSDRLHYVL